VTHVGRDASGRDRFCYISEEITERKRAEEEIHRLNRSLERRATELATLIDVLPIGIGIAEDPACASIRVNATLAALLRVPPGANASLTAPEGERTGSFRVYRDGRLVPADELPMQTSASKGVAHRDLEFDFVFGDGTTVKLLENVAPLFDEQGRPRGCVGAFLDVTERRKAESERERLLLALRDADRRKDEFLAMLAHELRNPLSAISNAVQLIQDKVASDPDLRWCRDVIQRQARHLSRLLDDLLDVSRISRGKVTLRRQAVDLREAIRRAAETTRPLVEQKRHALDFRLPDEPLVVDADPARMEQVVVNLLGNAAKYSEEGGRIDVVAERDGREAVVRVRDRGMGIPPDALGRVFELFTQAETSIDRSQGGLGVGLTIVKSLVELHGGAVSATSEGVGLGSEFVVRLPALDPGAAESGGEMPARGARSRARRIVVVDDNVDANLSIARVLAALGHEVESAYDGPSALELVDAFRPGVVLLDLGLPGMDGFEVAARLRERPQGERLVLVAVTGYGQESDRRRSRASGLDHHLVKPVDLRDLLAILDEPAADG
jgi:signal transduction histidine kinase/CheY-like chemotaxis protein